MADSAGDLVPHNYQGAVIQQRLKDGYINASAMCKAAGKLWGHYWENGATKAFMVALSADIGIPISDIVQSMRGGPLQGTWVHPQAAIHLAQWVSPKFAVLVSKWVFEWMTGNSRSNIVWKQFQDRVSLVYDNVPVGTFCVFREIADLFASMFAHGIDPGSRLILDISVGRHWSQHWREKKLADRYGPRKQFGHYYPDYFPQAQSNPQPCWCYPEDAVPEFRRWMRTEYVPKMMPSYLRAQVRQGKITAEAANNTIVALESREKRRSIGGS